MGRNLVGWSFLILLVVVTFNEIQAVPMIFIKKLIKLGLLASIVKDRKPSFIPIPIPIPIPTSSHHHIPYPACILVMLAIWLLFNIGKYIIKRKRNDFSSVHHHTFSVVGLNYGKKHKMHYLDLGGGEHHHHGLGGHHELETNGHHHLERGEKFNKHRW